MSYFKENALKNGIMQKSVVQVFKRTKFALQKCKSKAKRKLFAVIPNIIMYRHNIFIFIFLVKGFRIISV